MRVNCGPAQCCVWPVLAPAGAWVRAGGCSARRCGSVAALCGRFTSAMRSCWNVLCSITPAVCRMSAKQDGLRNVEFLFRRGSRSPVVRSRVAVRLSGLAGLLRVCAFLYGDPDGERRRRRERGDDEGTRERSRRRCVSAFLRKHIGFAMFSAGSSLGAARPQTCAKEPLALWTLFI